MIRVPLPALGVFGVWRDAARRLASHRIPAEAVEWGGASLFTAEPLPVMGTAPVTVPKAFLTLAEAVLCHRDPEAPALLYSALLRHQDDRAALANPADPLTRRLEALAKVVRRDIHKMHAFVRFREVPTRGARRRFGAWFEPEHRIVEAAAPFFAKRFADMDWMIATPVGTARFDGTLSYGPASIRPDLPEDDSEVLWGTYFSNIFNPARIKLDAMRSEMPLKYWKNLPETRLIPEMLAAAEGRVRAMQEALPTEPPKRAATIIAQQIATLDEAESQARDCTLCGLCEGATRMVWGRGDPEAPLMLVGEAPGDHEDREGRPFVGPAGRVLIAVMEEARLGPVWLTNAVKHFKFSERGKQRLHQRPNQSEVQRCRWWLDIERRIVRPSLTVALGATAAYALTGESGALSRRRGRIEHARDGGDVLITWHPAAILRGSSGDRVRAELVSDLSEAAARLRTAAAL